MRRVRRNLLLLLAVIAVVLVFLALSRGRTPRDGAELPAAESSPPSEALDLLAAEAPRPQEPPPNDEGPVALVPRDHGKAASAPSDVLHLLGTVVVSDANGRQYARESGRFLLLLWSSQTEAVIKPIRVEEGSWSLDVTGASRFQAMGAQSFELGKRAAIAETGPEERLRIPGHGRVDLQVRWPPRLTLHVRPSDGARAELFLTWCEPEPEAGTALAHPGILPLSSGGMSGQGNSTHYFDSPAEGSRWVYVGGLGYAWQRIEVLAAEYERTVTLERGGDLEVRVESFERDPGTQLRLFERGKDVPLAEITPGLWNPCRIEGLPLGWLEVRAYVGDPRSPDLYGSVETEILDGQTSAVTLYLNSR